MVAFVGTYEPRADTATQLEDNRPLSRVSGRATASLEPATGSLELDEAVPVRLSGERAVFQRERADDQSVEPVGHEAVTSLLIAAAKKAESLPSALEGTPVSRDQNRPPSGVTSDGKLDYTVPRTESLADQGRAHLLREAAALGISAIPVVGDVYDAASLIFKRDLITGQEYSPEEVAFGIVIASVGAGSPISATAALKAAKKLKPDEIAALVVEARRALKEHHLPKNPAESKFGSPFYGDAQKGYHVDPAHPGGVERHGPGADGPHVDFHNHNGSNNRKDWTYGRVYMNEQGEIKIVHGPFNKSN